MGASGVDRDTASLAVSFFHMGTQGHTGQASTIWSVVEWAKTESAQDSTAAARTAAMTDPVTGALTTFGLPVAHADLIAGVAFAAVLEGVACFAWLLALRSADAAEIAITPAQQGGHAAPVTEVTPSSNAVAALESPDAEQADDVTRVTTAIADGKLRGTVAEIRRFLGCSQATASVARKQIAAAIEQ